jgi:uncharacterized protein (DUF1810 family)
MKKTLTLVLVIFLAFQSFAQELKTYLEGIEEITNIKEISHATSFSEAYSFHFIQSLDHHQNADAVEDIFVQKVMIYYTNKTNPTVVNLEGYKIWGNYTGELTKLLNANQITIEHRFFGSSVPNKLDWSMLNVWQAATDQHKIIQALKPFFYGKFVSTGISKGGQTTIFHRYLYPEDVTASVPYVAPHNLEREDERIYTFLDTVGGDKCQSAIFEFQKLAFEKQEEILPLIQAKAEKEEWTFNKAGGIEKAYKLCILEYEFSFWQWGYASCLTIPDENDSYRTIYKHLLDISSIDFFSDQEYETFFPYFYQGLTEIGVYGYKIDEFKDFFEEQDEITFDFVIPDSLETNYENELMIEIDQWLQNEAENMLFVYGGQDTWSATQVNVEGNDRCLKMVLPKGHHATRINSFSDEEQEIMLSTLKQWLEIE